MDFTNQQQNYLIPATALPVFDTQTLDYFNETAFGFYQFFFYIFATSANWDEIIGMIESSLSDFGDPSDSEDTCLKHQGHVLECYGHFNDQIGRMLDNLRCLPPGLEFENAVVTQHDKDTYLVTVSIINDPKSTTLSPRYEARENGIFYNVDSPLSANPLVGPHVPE